MPCVCGQFCKYCKASGDDAKARFLEEVVRYKVRAGTRGQRHLSSASHCVRSLHLKSVPSKLVVVV